MGDGDWKETKVVWSAALTLDDEQCGAKCGAITIAVHGSVVFSPLVECVVDNYKLQPCTRSPSGRDHSKITMKH